MDLNQFTQFFDNPKVSIFNRSKKAGFDMRIGPWYPTYWDLCSFGNSHKGNSSHSMRLAPMLAPNFSDLRLQEHTAVVPLRVIMEDYEKKFNYATNVDGASLPHFTPEEYARILRAILQLGKSPIGSLLDFLGFPVYADLYKSMLQYVDNREYFSYQAYDDESVTYTVFEIATGPITRMKASLNYRGSLLSNAVRLPSDLPDLMPFSYWIYCLSNDIDLSSDYTTEEFGNQYFDWLNYVTNYRVLGKNYTLGTLVSHSPFETVDSATNAYLNYIFNWFLNNYLSSIAGSQNVVYTTLPLRAYWRCHYDWNINGNFVDRDIMLESHVYSFESTVNYYVEQILGAGETMQVNKDRFLGLMFPANRLWDNDFFTSLLPTSAVDNAISIPANSTVLDLAKLTAIQKLVLKLSYSSRYRDVVWNIFKIKPSDARLQQSSIIKQKTHNIGIGESIQTSETTMSSVLGAFAGRGYSSGRNDGYHVFCEEPCVVLSFMSLVPRASYADSIHPLIHVDDILDFPIPDMDVLGNQPIYADLLSGNIEDADVVLGYGRQYQEWLYQYNTVHGDFKTSLDYWQLIRRFSDTPAINEDFLRIDDHDDLDRIFSVPNAPHAFIDVFYNCFASRHVHRSVRIQI